VEVNRNRQILIPVKLIKRNDFDNDVKLVFQGQPPKVEIEPRTIPKGTTEQVQRIFVPPTVPLGTYTLLMRGQGQVSYTRPAADAADTAKPQNLNVFPPADAIVLCIKEHPATLAVSVPGDGAIKRGASIEVAVTVNRLNGFQGAVALSLPLPPNVQGLAADPVTIAADQNQGVLRISAADSATEGPLANMVVRAGMQFHGDAAVDQPLTLKVVP
jgi:hypothetical protein